LHLEATTYGTSSVGKHSFLMERGLNHPIDYRNQDFLSSIMSLNGGKGVELVIPICWRYSKPKWIFKHPHKLWLA
jgi:NADPH:quinone reductase-like Zn-dependent oxidoreductase